MVKALCQPSAPWKSLLRTRHCVDMAEGTGAGPAGETKDLTFRDIRSKSAFQLLHLKQKAGVQFQKGFAHFFFSSGNS